MTAEASPDRPDRIGLILRTSPGNSETALPAGTEVLVLPADAVDRINPLSGVNRDRYPQRILNRARRAPGATYAVLGADGETQTSVIEAGQRAYVLARTPQGTYYESQALDDPGYAWTSSRKVPVQAVPDTVRPTMADAFQAALRTDGIRQIVTTSLTLRAKGDPLPPETRVRVWKREERTRRALNRRPVSKTARKDTLRSKGVTNGRYERTWRSGQTLYVAAETPRGILYESVVGNRASYDRVVTGRMRMAEVPDSAREVVQGVFREAPVGGPQVPWGAVLAATGVIGAVALGWLVRRHLKDMVGRTPTSKGADTEATDDSSKTAEGTGERQEAQDQVRSLQQKNEVLERRLESMEEKYGTLLEERDRLRKTLESKRERIQDLERAVSTSPDADDVRVLRRQVEDLKKEVDRYKRTILSLQAGRQQDAERIHSRTGLRTGGMAQPLRHEKPFSSSGPPPTDEMEQAAQESAECFVDWCRNRDTMLDRYYMFERFLKETRDETWTVFPVYLDPQAGAVRLVERQPGTTAVFWAAQKNGWTWLFPKPKDSEAFEHVQPVFQSSDNPAPETLSRVRPAPTTQAGDALEVEEKGVMQ
jgi:hypothetical protein